MVGVGAGRVVFAVDYQLYLFACRIVCLLTEADREAILAERRLVPTDSSFFSMSLFLERSCVVFKRVAELPTCFLDVSKDVFGGEAGAAAAADFLAAWLGV